MLINPNIRLMQSKRSIVVTAPVGTAVTCKFQDGSNIIGVVTPGVYSFLNLISYGEYTITAVNNNYVPSMRVVTRSISVLEDKEYQVSITFSTNTLTLNFDDDSDLDLFSKNIPSGSYIDVPSEGGFCVFGTDVTDMTPSMSINFSGANDVELRYTPFNHPRGFRDPSIAFTIGGTVYNWYPHNVCDDLEGYIQYLPFQKNNVSLLTIGSSSILYEAKDLPMNMPHIFKVVVENGITKFISDGVVIHRINNSSLITKCNIGILNSWWQTRWWATLDYLRYSYF